MRISVDKVLCVGCEKCVRMCPEVFQMESEFVVVVTESVPPELQKACREAAENCPVTAIIIER